ncbi:MAG: S8 family serine peptidase, partial [Bacteroidaceae bacterium]|nr:S8 family serine peptidase [Bacteroidaceae bacterium]
HENSQLELPQTYTGKGIITGIVDGGFDPNHANFRDEDGNSRFTYFATAEVNSLGTGVNVSKYASPDPSVSGLSLQNFTTDDSQQTHGTHTLGIMAGSYRGDCKFATYDPVTGNDIALGDNPFYGVAYNSSLYASSGASFDALIAMAVENMMEDRWYHDFRPMVVNLSLGGNQGPHDGTGPLSQYLDMIAEEDRVIFCVSAGNEGNIPLSYHQTFTEDNNTFATLIRPYVYLNVRYGIVEIYSDTADDFEVQVILYNKARKKVARVFPLTTKDGSAQYLCSSEDYRQGENDIVDATFANAYDGYVGVGGMIDEESGRFYAGIDYYVTNTDNNPADETTTEAQYTLGFRVIGKAGQRIDCFCDGTFTALDRYGYESYTDNGETVPFVDGSFNGTISDIATGKNIIAVGAYNTKDYAGGLGGVELGYDGAYPENYVTDYSSFGTLVDGRNMPHVVAPGCLIVSSISTPYFNNAANGLREEVTCAKTTEFGRDSYWYPMMGTSMASPLVAGAIALWLEANPNLSVYEARDILMQTAVNDEYTAALPDPVQAGAGKFNAYAGLKEVLRRLYDTGVQGVIGDADPRVVFTPVGVRRFSVLLPSAQSLNAALYNLHGVKVLAAHAQGNETTIDASHLTPGIYLLRVNDGKAQKIVIK